MQISEDISSALHQIETIKKSIEESDDVKLQSTTEDSLKIILDILQDPVFKNIVKVQDSLSELNNQIVQHPSILPADFDINISGDLILTGPMALDMYGSDEYPDEQRVPSAQISPRSPSSPTRNYDSQIDEDRPQSVISDSSKQHMDLMSSEWAQIQAIDLENDGTGLGFGIIGGRTSGVIVKTILPGGVADRDGRLQSGDHILQIGEVNLHEMISEQVASVLRQSGKHVRLVVARPVASVRHVPPEITGTAVVPTRLLADPQELEEHLINIGYPEIFGNASPPLSPKHHKAKRSAHSSPATTLNRKRYTPEPDTDGETEKFTVELTKDANGLGVTIAGYVCEKEELSGIFVKSVSPGSAAYMSGRIQVNDRIIEVDGQSLQGFSNHQAVEVLKKSGTVVTLCLERYLRGPKYDQLQQAIAANEMKPPTPNTPPSSHHGLIPPPGRPHSVQSTSSHHSKHSADNIRTNDDYLTAKSSVEGHSSPSASSGTSNTSYNHMNKKLMQARDSIEQKDSVSSKSIKKERKDYLESTVDDEFENPMIASQGSTSKPKYWIESELSDDMEISIKKKWRAILGPEVQIIVAQIRKFAATKGLGISLEGTVDVEDGREVRPHHYIRSILPEGPVGQNGLLHSGDELLEVNGQRLLGMNHVEVVSILKELPQDVRMVCGRVPEDVNSYPDDALRKNLMASGFGGSQNLENLLHNSERLVKAKSDGSLATATGSPDDIHSKMKSRSLEPLTGLAMWSSEPQIIELIKGERGLGFSILDYQDPMDPNDTLIVIRSLVPGGVAQMDGRLIPGDRLMFVNDINLENASLDQAVQALKGAPKGVVRIGVAKPLPMADTSLNLSGNGQMTQTTGGGEPDIINVHRK